MNNMETRELKYYTFYDLETYGLNPKSDRIAQFAAIRTDENFNILEETMFYCLPQKDYVPNIESMLITKITPADIESRFKKQSYKESEFIDKIIGFLGYPDNCVLGYNNVKFDDEFIRFTAYRNLYDPYTFNTSLRDNRSKWDIVNLIRACHALDPDGINWPINPETNTVSMRLEHLSEANNLPHEHAHDALSDVEATVHLTKLIKEKKPKLFNYFFNLRTKSKIEDQFYDVQTERFTTLPLIHIDTQYGYDTMYTGIILPVKLVRNKGAYIYGWRLDQDITPLLNINQQMSDEELAELELKSYGFVKINIARCPAISTYAVLAKKPDRAQRLGINLQLVDNNMKTLFSVGCLEPLLQRFINANNQSVVEDSNPDPEHTLYTSTSGTLNDKSCKDKLHQMEKTDPYIFDQIKFENPILKRLLFRYKARNFEQYLNANEIDKWNSHLQRYYRQKLPELHQQIIDAMGKYSDNEEILKLLHRVAQFYNLD